MKARSKLKQYCLSITQYTSHTYQIVEIFPSLELIRTPYVPTFANFSFSKEVQENLFGFSNGEISRYILLIENELFSLGVGINSSILYLIFRYLPPLCIWTKKTHTECAYTTEAIYSL